MCNSLATFQSMMDAIFSDMIDDNLVIIYMEETLHGILDNLQDIRIGFKRGLDVSTFLSPDFSPLITFFLPHFDPLQTIGKYE